MGCMGWMDAMWWYVMGWMGTGNWGHGTWAVQCGILRSIWKVWLPCCRMEFMMNFPTRRILQNIFGSVRPSPDPSSSSVSPWTATTAAATQAVPEPEPEPGQHLFHGLFLAHSFCPCIFFLLLLTESNPIPSLRQLLMLPVWPVARLFGHMT